MSERRPRTAARKWLRRAAVAAGVLLPTALIALWLTFQHIPAWYKPVPVTSAVVEQARTSVTDSFDRVSDQVVAGETFEVVLEEAQVNAWLAAAPQVWPAIADVVPPEIKQSAVAFEEAIVRIGVRVQHNGWKAILSVGLRLDVDADGETVGLALTDLHGGSLPAPRSLLRELLDPLLARARRTRARDVDEPWRYFLDEVRSVDDLFEGLHTENRFVWPNGDRPFRIRSIRVGGGTLRLTIEPL